MSQLIVIDTEEGVAELLQYLSDKEYIVYDCETTGIDRDARVIGFSVCAEEDKAFYVILDAWFEGQLHEILPASTANKFLDLFETKQLIMHNAIFDCLRAHVYFKHSIIHRVHTDTMILAHLLDENRSAGLKSLGEQYFGETATDEQQAMKESVLANGGEWSAVSKQMYKADAHLLGKYGAKDALLTFKLFNVLLVDLYDQGLDKFFYEDESMPLLRTVTYDLNYAGLMVDTQKLTALQKQLEMECGQLKSFIEDETAPLVEERYPNKKKKDKFNFSSNAQLSWLLFGKLELEFGTLTKKGKEVCKDMGMKLPYTFKARKEFIHECLRLHEQENKLVDAAKTAKKKYGRRKYKEPWSYIDCSKKILALYAQKYKWLQAILDYKKKDKLLNTYVYGIQERIQYGTIYPSFLQHGTTSGRFSSRDPNWQNLPRDDKRIKDCIISRPRRVFVGADYSQLEPRVFASFSKDPRLIAAFEGEDDFYSVIGMAVYQKSDCTPRKEGSPDAFGVKYKKLRDFSKVIALASTYGATAHQLAPTTGKSKEDTQIDIDNYFETFPRVKEFQLDSHFEAKTNGQVVNLFGRPRRMPEAKSIPKGISHEELPYEARNVLNLAVNHRIQSTGASIVNRAAIAFWHNCKTAGIDCQIVTQVHDSLVVECLEKDAEDVALLLQDAMENTVYLPGVKLEAVPKIGRSLSEV